MSWTKFRDEYLFTINFCIVLSVILFSIRRDFEWHSTIIAWLCICLFIPSFREAQKTFLKWVGLINSTIILTSFYFLFFTPFSLLYRMAFRNSAFKKASTRFVKKETISEFSRPF